MDMEESRKKLESAEEVRKKLESGDYKSVENDKGKSDVWKTFLTIIRAENSEPTPFVQCKVCSSVMKHHLTTLSRHVCSQKVIFFGRYLGT